jgi:formate dehydrogenase subunit delta
MSQSTIAQPPPATESEIKLVRMANQIADSFQAYPSKQATLYVADHINHYWSPKMRASFLRVTENIQQQEYAWDNLSQIVIAARTLIKVN